MNKRMHFSKCIFNRPYFPLNVKTLKSLTITLLIQTIDWNYNSRNIRRKKTLKVEDTQGNERELLRWGEFRFKITDTDCRLQAYKNSPEEERLFVPFRDATSGKETYGAGRYLDLETEKHQTSEGKWVLDFNEAYNPWCAYSKDYACPFAPPENWLKVPIYAGEKDYLLKTRGRNKQQLENISEEEI